MEKKPRTQVEVVLIITFHPDVPIDLDSIRAEIEAGKPTFDPQVDRVESVRLRNRVTIPPVGKRPFYSHLTWVCDKCHHEHLREYESCPKCGQPNPMSPPVGKRAFQSECLYCQRVTEDVPFEGVNFSKLKNVSGVSCPRCGWVKRVKEAPESLKGDVSK